MRGFTGFFLALVWVADSDLVLGAVEADASLDWAQLMVSDAMRDTSGRTNGSAGYIEGINYVREVGGLK